MPPGRSYRGASKQQVPRYYADRIRDPLRSE